MTETTIKIWAPFMWFRIKDRSCICIMLIHFLSTKCFNPSFRRTDKGDPVGLQIKFKFSDMHCIL